MDAAGIVYEELLAEENVELAQRYRIMQAPRCCPWPPTAPWT